MYLYVYIYMYKYIDVYICIYIYIYLFIYESTLADRPTFLGVWAKELCLKVSAFLGFKAACAQGFTGCSFGVPQGFGGLLNKCVEVRGWPVDQRGHGMAMSWLRRGSLVACVALGYDPQSTEAAVPESDQSRSIVVVSQERRIILES